MQRVYRDNCTSTHKTDEMINKKYMYTLIHTHTSAPSVSMSVSIENLPSENKSNQLKIDKITFRILFALELMTNRLENVYGVLWWNRKRFAHNWFYAPKALVTLENGDWMFINVMTKPNSRCSIRYRRLHVCVNCALCACVCLVDTHAHIAAVLATLDTFSGIEIDFFSCAPTKTIVSTYTHAMGVCVYYSVHYTFYLFTCPNLLTDKIKSKLIVLFA